MGLADASLQDRLRESREQGLKGVPADELIGLALRWPVPPFSVPACHW